MKRLVLTRGLVTTNGLTQRTTKASDVLELLPIVDNDVRASDSTRSYEVDCTRRG